MGRVSLEKKINVLLQDAVDGMRPINRGHRSIKIWTPHWRQLLKKVASSRKVLSQKLDKNLVKMMWRELKQWLGIELDGRLT